MTAEERALEHKTRAEELAKVYREQEELSRVAKAKHAASSQASAGVAGKIRGTCESAPSN